MKNRWLIAGLILFLFLAAGALLWLRPWQDSAPQAAEPSLEMGAGAVTAETEPGARDAAVFAEARLIPVREANLAFESSGRLQELLVAEGDEVTAGTPLLRLDTSDAEIAVRQAQAAVAQAEANLMAARARLGSATEGQNTAQLAVQAAEAGLAVVSAAPQEEAIAAAEAAVAEANAGVTQAAGQRDATLEPNSAEIAAAEAQLEAAQAQLFAVRIANEPTTQDEEKPQEERELAQRRLNAAEAEVAAAQAELERAQAGATEAEQQAATNAVGSAAAMRDVAEAQLALLQAGARQEQVTVAQEKVRQAQSAAAQAEAQVALAETAVGEAEAGVEVARTRLAAAQTALDRLTLTAPFAGTVAAVHVEGDQVVTAGAPAVTLADLSTWEVETTDLTELDVAKVAEGQPVQITVDAFPGKMLAGEIVEIAEAPQAVGTALQGQPLSDDVTYRVTVALGDAGGLALRWGMTALVRVDAPDAARPSQTLSGDVLVEGEVVPRRYSELSFQTGGTVDAILVSEGESVEAGGALIRLDGRQQEIALEQAQGQAAAAQAALEAAEQQQAVAQAAVITAQREAEIAAAQLALVEAGARPEEVAAAEAQLAAARSGVAQAAAARDAQLEAVGTAEQVAAAQAALASAQADVTALREQYDDLIGACFDTPEGEVCPLYGPVEEQARAQLQAAQAGADAAQAGLDRLLQGATPAQQQAANAAVSAAVARRDQAEAQLALIQAGATPELVRQAQVAVEIAQAQVGVARAALAETDAAVAQAEAGVTAARAGVEAAEAAVERTVLRAPLAARIARLSANPGEVIPAGAPVITLVGAGPWQVETRDLTELDVPRLQEGDTLRVSFEALPEVEVQGTVTQIALTPGMDRGDIVYQATIDLQETDQLALRWGMTAQVELQP